MSPLSQAKQTMISSNCLREAHHIVNKHPKIELRFCNGTALNFSGEITQALLATMIQEARS